MHKTILSSNTQSKFWAFSKILGGPNYFPFIRSYSFFHSENDTLNQKKFNDLIGIHSLTGIIEACSMQAISNLIDNAVQWDVDSCGLLKKTTNQQLIKARTCIFFDCIEQKFFTTNSKYFIYHQGPNDYFANTNLWGFCFILSNKTEGLAIYGKVWPNATSCKPDSLDEELWRKNYDML